MLKEAFTVEDEGEAGVLSEQEVCGLYLLTFSIISEIFESHFLRFNLLSDFERIFFRFHHFSKLLYILFTVTSFIARVYRFCYGENEI